MLKSIFIFVFSFVIITQGFCQKFSDSLRVVFKNGNYLIETLNGETAKTAGVLYVDKVSEGYCRIVIGFGNYKEVKGVKMYDKTKNGFMDTLGIMKVDPIFEDGGKFSEGVAYVKQNDKYGFVDKSGKFIIAPKYKIVGAFVEGKAFISDENGTIIFIDKKGNVIGKVADKISLGSQYMNYPFQEGRHFEERIENGFYFSEDLINIKGKYYDKTGKLIITTFGQSFDCKDGMIRFTISERDSKGNNVWKYGYYDKTGKMIIKPVYNSGENFKEGKAKVGYLGSKGTWNHFFIDKTGKIIK